MGFAICQNLHRNTVGWGGEEFRTTERDRISTKKRLKNASKPSIQAEIAPQPIPNSIFNFFLGEGRAPDSPPNLRVRLGASARPLVKGLR